MLDEQLLKHYKYYLKVAISEVKNTSWFTRTFNKDKFECKLRTLRLNIRVVSQILEHKVFDAPELKSSLRVAEELYEKYHDWLDRRESREWDLK